MAIIELSRAQLNQEFRDGERPSGDDFASAWLSFLHKSDDGVKIDANGNLELNRGITIKDVTAGQAGTIRFNAGQLQIHDGASFNNVSADSGAFLPVEGGPSVAFGAGNVGIGNVAVVPTHRLEVSLGNNTATADQRVRMGNLIVHNGSTGDAAYISNTARPGDLDFALRQDGQGNTTVNTANNTQLVIAQNGANRIRVLVSGAIELTPLTTVTIAGNTAIGTIATNRNLNVFGNLTVSGTINGTVIPPSDRRLKTDVQPFEEGFQKILSLNPVKFKYNGMAGTPNDGKEYVGFIAQDLQEIYPELVVTMSKKLNSNDPQETELFSYDPGPLIFVLINAIKELSARIDKLEKQKPSEKQKPNEKRKSKGTTGANN